MKLRFYTDDKYEKYLLREMAQVEKRNDMTVDVVDGGTFVIDTNSGAFGIFDADGVFVKSSLQYRGKNTNFVPQYVSQTEFVDADAVFMGNAYHHFGHFMIEHLNRAWAMDKLPRVGLKYVFVDNKDVGAKKWLFDFMDMMGVGRDDVLILNRSMQFRRVFVPTQSFNNSGKWWAEQFIVPFDVMRKNLARDQVYDKVYVSRAKLPENMRTYGEEKIQKIFEKNGFSVIYPETLPLKEQVAIIGNCRTLAGCAGTALHLALFMRPGGRVIQLNRSTDVRDSGVLQCRMCQMKNLGFDVVAASVETFKSQHGGAHAPQIIGVNKYLKRFFDDNGFVYSDDDLLPDDVAQQQYQAQMKMFKSMHGGGIKQKSKKLLIKLISCVIPGRVWRGRVRKWMKEHL